MTAAEPAKRPIPLATINNRPAPTVLADSVERYIAAVFGTWPASPPKAGPTPQPAIEET